MADGKQVSMLVAAKPGLMRNSLLAFLRAMPGVDILAVGDSVDTLLYLARSLRPEVCLVDANLVSESAAGIVRQLKTEQPRMRCIVLSDNLQQQQQSIQAGANQALMKGFLDERLREAVLGSAG